MDMERLRKFFQRSKLEKPEKSAQEIKGFIVSGESAREVLDQVESKAHFPKYAVLVVGEEEKLVSLFNLEELTRRFMFNQSSKQYVGTFNEAGKFKRPDGLLKHGTIAHILVPKFVAEVWDQKNWWEPEYPGSRRQKSGNNTNY